MCSSKPLKYKYMNDINDIDDELKCLICQQPLQSPVSHTLCHYDFCQDCIEIYLEKNRTCPKCEHFLNNYNIEQNNNESINLLEIFSFVPVSTRIVLNRLNQLLVQCILCNEENIPRLYFEDHEEVCMKKIVKCQSVDMKCTWKGIREKLNEHLKKCIFQKIRPIVDKFQDKFKTIDKKQIQMQKSMKRLEKQLTFIHAFINEGIPMTKNCPLLSTQCRYKETYRNDSIQTFICRMCNVSRYYDQISVHACNNGAICRLCFNEQYPLDETKTDLEDNDGDKEDFSPISTIHSP